MEKVYLCLEDLVQEAVDNNRTIKLDNVNRLVGELIWCYRGKVDDRAEILFITTPFASSLGRITELKPDATFFGIPVKEMSPTITEFCRRSFTFSKFDKFVLCVSTNGIPSLGVFE